mmetsp:Transcript_49525/g.127834  ORF Transcript_49525/g.127834 Transcript_49525/m.127834 type:complete len:488 (+) Transcript_49525:77-1540(+)
MIQMIRCLKSVVLGLWKFVSGIFIGVGNCAAGLLKCAFEVVNFNVSCCLQCTTGCLTAPCSSCCGCGWAVQSCLGYGPQWNSFRDLPKRRGQKPVVCVAGLASSSLQAKSGALGRYTVNYCSIDALTYAPLSTLGGLKLRLVDGVLRDGTKVASTACVEGVTVKPVEGTAGIRTLNPGEKIPISVWSGLLDGLYTELNFHAVTYDWRRWGDRVFAEETVANFRQTVESSVRRDGRKSAVIAHSMGASVVLYCLSAVGDSWVKKHVDKVILVAPAHMGSPCMLPSYAHAPIGTTADQFFPLPNGLEHGISQVTATWACMIAEMPVPVGGAAPWPADHVFASTPSKEYRLADMEQFLKDAHQSALGNGMDRKFGPALYPGVLKMASKMKAPPVPTHLVYSDGTDTISRLRYEDEDLTGKPEVAGNEPGDGTIVAASIEAVGKAWEQSDRGAVHYHKAPGATSHKDLIACDFTTELVRRLLAPDELLDNV